MPSSHLNLSSVEKTHIGIGFSRELTTLLAAREAALEAKAQTRQSSVDVAIVFCTPHYSPLETLHVIRQTLNPAKIVGCSTAGLIVSSAVEMRGITIIAISSQDIKFSAAVMENIAQNDLRPLGAMLAKNIVGSPEQSKRQSMLLFSDGLIANYSPFITGIQEMLGRMFPIVGAGSSDLFHFKETHQYFQDKPLTRSVVALLLGGQLTVSTASRHGWKPLGKPRYVDKVDNHVIKTIDGKKACAIYEDYLSLDFKNLKKAHANNELALYPLGIYLEHHKEYLLRDIIDIAEDGSLVCRGDIPAGAEVHVMINNKDFCKSSGIEAAWDVKRNLADKQPKLILIFESLTRHKLLGRDSSDEIKSIKEIFGPSVPVAGMYSYGEISLLKSEQSNEGSQLQNGTITIFAIA
ncbi:MAG: FIST N-terminal domain-containing protein [Candidatus Omnitrophota bacterium]